MRAVEISPGAVLAGKILLVALLIAEIVLVVVSDRSRVTEPGSSSGSLGSQISRAADLSNNQGQYTVRYPSRWKAVEEGPVTRLESPHGAIIVSIGPGVRGGLENATAALSATIRGHYEQVVLAPQESDLIAGHVAIRRDGSALNDNGVRLRLRLVTVEGGRGTYALVAFSKSRTQRARALIADIVNSFRPLA